MSGVVYYIHDAAFYSFEVIARSRCAVCRQVQNRNPVQIRALHNARVYSGQAKR
jgi:hypothetical protein